MPVIGRLDDQVDAVLIAPISNTRAAGEKVADSTAPTHAAQPSKEALADESAQAAQQRDNSDDERPELPVWLL